MSCILYLRTKDMQSSKAKKNPAHLISYCALKEQITHNGVSRSSLTPADKTQISYLLSPAYPFRMFRGTRNLADLMTPKIFSNLSWSAAKMCLFCGRIVLKTLKCLCFKLILFKVLQKNLDKFIRFHVPSHYPRIYIKKVLWHRLSHSWIEILKSDWRF